LAEDRHDKELDGAHKIYCSKGERLQWGKKGGDPDATANGKASVKTCDLRRRKKRLSRARDKEEVRGGTILAGKEWRGNI